MAKRKAKTEPATQVMSPVVSEHASVDETTPEEVAPAVEETPPEETTPEATPATPAENVPEVKEPDEAAAQQQGLDDFLKDEGDDLDEKTPPEGQEPKEEVKEPSKPAEVPPAVAPSPPAEPKPAEAAPEPTPVEVKPEPTPPTTPPAAPVEPTPETPSAVVPPTPAVDMEQIRKTYRENRDTLEKQVASEVYNFSEEQVEQFDSGDLSVVSNLAAKVYMDAVTGSVAHVLTFLPQLVESVLAGRDIDQTNEKQFYDANPHLDKAKHGETVGKFGMAYRSLFPNASSEEFIRDVGAQTMVALRITPAGNSGTPPSEEPEAPKVPAFQPASAGGGKGAAPAPTNVFEVLADEMAAEELDMDQ